MEVSDLHGHPFLRTLTAEQVARLLPCAREAEFGEGAFLFREGEAADTLYLVRSGCVALEQHISGQGDVIVESLCAGDIVGLSWLFPPAHWTLDARCTGPVRALALSAACLRDQMQADSALGMALLTHAVHALYQRLLRVRLQRLDVYQAAP